MVLPFRPVAITLGKTVNNGWGGYECCWARTVAVALVGALEVPGGTLGTTVRLNRPMSDRIGSVTPGIDGFMAYPFNPTDREHWSPRPNIRNAYRTLVPLAANGPWSQALGPTHLAWMFLDGTPEGLPAVTFPEVWFLYRTNPAISFWDTAAICRQDVALPLRRRLRLYARRIRTTWPTSCCRNAPTWRGCSSSASAARSMSSSSGTRRVSRFASPPSRPRARRATSPTSRPSWRGGRA